MCTNIEEHQSLVQPCKGKLQRRKCTLVIITAKDSCFIVTTVQALVPGPEIIEWLSNENCILFHWVSRTCIIERKIININIYIYIYIYMYIYLLCKYEGLMTINNKQVYKGIRINIISLGVLSRPSHPLKLVREVRFPCPLKQ